ncbi:MAG: molecular chaperone DnaK [Chloroflexi bacterium]|nr:molecular chaperone DnaK [Chloroflexota bacterium]
MARAIGIDLGTTFTVAATIQGGRPQIVPNRQGQRLTPSVVAFTEAGEALVGQPARESAARNPQGAIFSVKRIMGSGRQVSAGGGLYTPQEVSSFILKQVRADAEAALRERIDRAVITVPAYFNDRQRQATREAARLAGLEVQKIINEPTAAALAYGLARDEAHSILVWDLGGGTFDVSILELGEGIFEVRAVSGDSHLGGDDIDALVAAHLAEEYKKAYGIDLPQDAVMTFRLREAAERAKIQLSSAHTARVSLPLALSQGGRPLEVELTRTRLEEMAAALMRRMETCTGQALADAGLAPGDIDRVLLVGGATRMPAVRDLARRMLGKEPYRSINPDEVVALGAAIQSGMLLGQVEKAVLLDVLPLSLGVETQGGLMARLIPRNTPLPAAGARLFTTAADYQASMDIHVLQGERELAGDNISLGRFELAGLPSAPRGMARVEVAFHVDGDGLLHISATDLLTEGEMMVRMASALLHPQEVEHLLETAHHHSEADRASRRVVEARLEAERVAAAAELALDVAGFLGDPRAEELKRLMAGLESVLAGEEAQDIEPLCQQVQALLEAILKEHRPPRPGQAA